MNARLCQLLVTLGSKDIETFWITLSVLKVRKERTPGLIEQVNSAELAALGSDMQPSALWTHMCVLSQKMSNITDTASCPIAERKECFSPEVFCLRDQCLQNRALLI